MTYSGRNKTNPICRRRNRAAERRSAAAGASYRCCFDVKLLLRTRVKSAGASHRQHQRPVSEVRKLSRSPLRELRKQRGAAFLIMLVLLRCEAPVANARQIRRSFTSAAPAHSVCRGGVVPRRESASLPDISQPCGGQYRCPIRANVPRWCRRTEYAAAVRRRSKA